jgi:predicted adenine nucleotide alpha hydrolase (AANH) superfamily ATPase
MINNKKILFHMCCAPCSYKTSEILVNEGYTVTGFFYNPNIHPDFEFRRRKENVKKLALFKGIDIIYSDIYDIKTWETYNKSSEKRCKMCYTLRAYRDSKKSKGAGLYRFYIITFNQSIPEP